MKGYSVGQVRGGLYWLFVLVLAGLVALFLGGCSVGPVNFGGASDPSAGSTPSPGTGRATAPAGKPEQAQAQPTASPAIRAISGKVLDAYTGQPVAGAEVTAGGILTETTTNGAFWFDAAPPTAKISAKAEGYALKELDPGPDSSVTVKLRPSTLSGRVTDATTGQPLAEVLVKLVKPAPVQPAATLTTSTDVTATVLPATTVTNSHSLLMKGLAGPVEAPTTAPTASASDDTPATVEDAPTPSQVPPTPTATPRPKLVPPTGPDFVAVYTDENGNYFFNDVPENAGLTFKMPGYKLTRMPVGDTARKDVALEQFKVEAIYITAPVISTKKLFDGLLKFISESRINAVVLNVQNDNSEWVFDTKNPDAVAAKNTDVFLPDMPEIVKDLKNRGLYTIARVVTFQQPTMAKARLDLAVKSSVTGKAWLGGELNQQAWLDATRPAAQDYVIDMTKEVIALGFDEVQYDYVRFPSDPAPKEPGKPVYSRPLTDTDKALAIEQFVTKAHNLIEPTDAFMSLDIFGYTLWPDRDGVPLNGLIGQVFESLVTHTDYVCPMIYPSHFSRGEQGCAKPSTCAYKMVHKSGEYARKRFAGARAKYRPWLEDFDWYDADYTSPGTKKVAEQMQAAKETGAWGWQWWDAANEYQPRSAFKK